MRPILYDIIWCAEHSREIPRWQWHSCYGYASCPDYEVVKTRAEQLDRIHAFDAPHLVVNYELVRHQEQLDALSAMPRHQVIALLGGKLPEHYSASKGENDD